MNAKKILILSYYWSPSGGPGVQRWLKMAKYLQLSGYQVYVYTPENPSYPVLDESMESPDGVILVKQPILEPAQLFSKINPKANKNLSQGQINPKEPNLLSRFALWTRGNFFIPDARFLWVKPSIKFLKNYLQEKEIPTIITTGPPHSMHLIGMGLKSILKIQWIADFRDPWTNIYYHKDLKLSNYAKNKHLKLESKVLNNADKIIVTSWDTQKEFQSKSKRPIHLLTNGYDSQDIPSNILPSDGFNITHIGSIAPDRNPKKLWKIIADISNKNPRFKKELKIHFAGSVHPIILEELKNQGLLDQVIFHGYLSHDKAIELQHQSNLLLLLGHKDAKGKGIIHGKIFEYLSAKKPILIIGPKDSDMKKIIHISKAGKCFDYEHSIEVKDYIEAIYLNQIEYSFENFEQFSRENLTQQLIKIIES